jgi:hypothetical protein
VNAAEARTAGEQLARRTRRAQELPRTVRDPGAVGRVVALLVRPDRSEFQDAAGTVAS